MAVIKAKNPNAITVKTSAWRLVARQKTKAAVKAIHNHPQPRLKVLINPCQPTHRPDQVGFPSLDTVHATTSLSTHSLAIIVAKTTGTRPAILSECWRNV